MRPFLSLFPETSKLFGTYRLRGRLQERHPAGAMGPSFGVTVDPDFVRKAPEVTGI